LVSARLLSLYNYDIVTCFDHLEYLRDVMKEVYGNAYDLILDGIKVELKRLVDIEDLEAHFFEIMTN